MNQTTILTLWQDNLMPTRNPSRASTSNYWRLQGQKIKKLLDLKLKSETVLVLYVGRTNVTHKAVNEIKIREKLLSIFRKLCR